MKEACSVMSQSGRLKDGGDVGRDLDEDKRRGSTASVSLQMVRSEGGEFEHNMFSLRIEKSIVCMIHSRKVCFINS